MFKIFFLKAHELVERVSAFFGNVIFRTFLMIAVFHCAPFFFQFEVHTDLVDNYLKTDEEQLSNLILVIQNLYVTST